MEVLAKHYTLVDIRLHEDELILINNALNEVCNGVDIADFEFDTRIGTSREKALALLDQFHAACPTSFLRTTRPD